MSPRPKVRPMLQPDGAFVVQFHSDAEIEHKRMTGRIEHVMSGDSARFDSLEMMLSFMAKHRVDGSSLR